MTQNRHLQSEELFNNGKWIFTSPWNYKAMSSLVSNTCTSKKRNNWVFYLFILLLLCFADVMWCNMRSSCYKTRFIVFDWMSLLCPNHWVQFKLVSCETWKPPITFSQRETRKAPVWTRRRAELESLTYSPL